jgi:hypothetical protein
MLARGYSAPAPLHPDEGQPYGKDGQEIGVWYLAGGRLCGRWSTWPLPANSLAAHVGEVDGVRASLVTVDCLLELKRGFARQPAGGPLREKDERDIAFLEELRRQT